MKVHLVAVCGMGMGSFAGLLKEAGHDVTGSDQAFYPPMSERLAAWGIPTKTGFSPDHIAAGTDLVVVGNACRKENPEAQAALQRGFRVQSFPQALSEMFITGKKSVVVAGTHGKTTTTSLIAYLLMESGLDPTFLIGGIPLDYGKSFHVGRSNLFVVEGDEYDTAFFDKRPKFIHYQPKIVVLTTVEYDHADIYPNMESYRSAFHSLLRLMPPDGLLVACMEDPEVRALAAQAPCPVVSVGLDPSADWQARDIHESHQGVSFNLVVGGESAGNFSIPMAGRHNVKNALASWAVVDSLGVSRPAVGGLLERFRGVARRLQKVDQVGGVTILDDFAHHPTEVRETVHAVRGKFAQEELVAVFEPRSNSSRRNIFQKDYEKAFEKADRVLIVPPYQPEKIPEGERFDSEGLVSALQGQGKKAKCLESVDAVVDELAATLTSGSVVLIMSNGAFGNIQEKLRLALKHRERK